MDYDNNDEILRHFKERTSTIKTFDPYKILRMDSGHIHRVCINTYTYSIPRTFLKITFSRDIFNRTGNDHNELFEYTWPLHHRGFNRNNSSIALTSGYVDDNMFRYIPNSELELLFNLISELLSYSKSNSKSDSKSDSKSEFDFDWGNFDWVNFDIFYIFKKKGYITIRSSYEGELLSTNNHEGEMMTCNIAKYSDVKIFNNATGAQYFLPITKVLEFYDIDNEKLRKIKNMSNNEEIICDAKSLPIQGIQIKKPIKIETPWKMYQYLRVGDYIIKRHNGDIYGVTQKDIDINYE